MTDEVRSKEARVPDEAQVPGAIPHLAVGAGGEPPGKPAQRFDEERAGRVRALIAAPSRQGDRVFRVLVNLFALAILGLAALTLWELIVNARPLIARDGLGFIWNNVWDVGRNLYGGRPFLIGTVISSGIAVLLAVPVALGGALFVTELSPSWLRRPISNLVELLAAVPSIAYGFWGLVVLAPFMRDTIDPVLIKVLGWTGLFDKPDVGLSLWTAGVVLAIMILPIIASISREVFTAVPRDQREAALGLGATRWEMIRMAVLPYARSGVVGAIVLGLGRALGETMAIVFVIGNAIQFKGNLLAPGTSVTAHIANTFQEVSTAGFGLAALLYLALVLFVVTLAVNIAARQLVAHQQRIMGGTR
jgi:phosphate transport system permease protein